MSSEPALTIRRLDEADLPAVAAIVQELRPHVDLALLRERFAEQSKAGYELHAGYIHGRPVALAGFRPVTALSRGRYIHLDDLIVTASHQTSGVGRRMLEHVEDEARRRGCVALFLDARPTAIPFYERCDYTAHTSPSYWKKL